MATEGSNIPKTAAELELEAAAFVEQRSQKLGRFMRVMGPGLVTGAADDDPSGIATYSQAGAQFGLRQLWTMLWLYPLMKVVQEQCAKIGAVTGKGLAAVVKERYPQKVLFPVVLLMVLANILNIGADIGAMAASTQLVVKVPQVILAPIYTLIILVLVIALSYRAYARLLKWLALTLLAYPITTLIVSVNWLEVLRAVVIPHLEFNKDFIFIITAVIGTTISPYLFFWQTSEVVEEEIAEHRLAQKGGVPRLSNRFMKNLKMDNAVGMLVSNIVAIFIIVTTAVVLNRGGVTTINSAADAARALEPLVKSFPNAGEISKLIFAAGVVGLGLLAVPVLAGSASYALSETFGWKEGLYRKFGKAKNFYIVIVIAMLLGMMMTYGGIDPIKALIYSAVFNAIAAVPLLFLIARIGSDAEVMGEHKASWISAATTWLTFAIMSVGAVAVLYGLFVH